MQPISHIGFLILRRVLRSFMTGIHGNVAPPHSYGARCCSLKSPRQPRSSQKSQTRDISLLKSPFTPAPRPSPQLEGKSGSEMSSDITLATEDGTAFELTSTTPAPAGDLILVVGPSRYEVRVYSLILTNVSSIFASKISIENYSDNAVVSDHPRLSLPDDDPKAMEIMCHILHGNSLNAEMGKIPPRLILVVAILAAKYDCTLALRAAAEYWLSPEIMDTIAQSGVVRPEKKDLLLAAYWFRYEKAFEAASLRLITEIAWSFGFLADGKSGEDEVVALRIASELFFTPIFTAYLSNTRHSGEIG